MAEKKTKGAASRFIPGSNIAWHREWRGLRDTWYDYTQWVKSLIAVVQFVSVSPVRVMRGMFRYRWMGSMLASLNMADRFMEGLRGPALRVGRNQMYVVFKLVMGQLGIMMKADRNFGDTELADKIVLTEQVMPAEIGGGYPDLTVLPLECHQGLEVNFMDQTLNPFYLDVMESLGLPSDSCRLSSNAAGVAVNGDFPDIGVCLISNNAPCDSSTMNSQIIDRHLNLPTMFSEIVMRWEDRATDKYALAVMKNNLAFIEEHTGEKFDEQAFWKVIDGHNTEVKSALEMFEYQKTPYSANSLTMASLYHLVVYTFSGGTQPIVRKYDRRMQKIMKKAYEKKTNCFPKTRFRALEWGGPACYYFHIYNWLYNCWGVNTVATMDQFSGNFTIPTDSVDAGLLGVARNNELGIMRRHLTGGWEHLMECWDLAEQFDCDLILLENDITCKGALGLTGILLEGQQTHRQKVMMVSQDMFDHRTISRQDMRSEINKFMFTVMQAEPLDPSLLEFDDDKGW